MSSFSISRCIAIQVTNTSEAESFYASLFGPPVRDPETEFKGECTRLFLEEGSLLGPILEIVTDDLEEARDVLVSRGCTVVCWGGIGKANYIRDPFGVHWNLWQENS